MVPFLTELFLQDPEPLVKAAAAEALGRIGVDPDGLAMGAFTSAVFPPLFMEDEQVLEAVAGAAGALSRFSGPPLSSPGTKILTALQGADKARNVRLRAEQELRSLH
jgi:outer membrane protein assembly factor BamB